MIEELLPASLAGERVDRVVAMVTGCTRAEASAAVEAGHVVLDGRTVTKVSQRVQADQTIRVESDPHIERLAPTADPAVEFDVIFADDDVIVVNKPAGLVVHPGPGHPGSTLVHGLLARFPEVAEVGELHRPGIVHRLDKGTSGLLVVARNEAARTDLVEQLASHEVERRYDALVWGHFETAHGTIDAPIGRSRRNPLLMTVAADGRYARTHYEVVEAFDEPAPLTHLSCQLETGRTHQIRVHLRSINRGVVGDDLYGGRRSTLPMDRPFLHARRLSFTHPGTGERVEFEQPMPAELIEVLGRCHRTEPMVHSEE